MRIQLEELDLLRPWPVFRLREGYYAMRVLVRIGPDPVGEIFARPVRKRLLTHKRLRRRLERRMGYSILRNLSRLAAMSMDAAPDGAASHSNQRISICAKKMAQKLTFDEIVLPTGLPEPWKSLSTRSLEHAAFPLPKVTVAICTRHRPDELSGCLDALRQLDYPNYEVLVVDNGDKPDLCRRVREIALRAGARYVEEPVAGLSRARNTALFAARTRWVAFTDDDCRPEAQWLRNLVRPLQDRNCGCVTGLVLPAHLENSSEITFEIYGGLGRGMVRQVFDRRFLFRDRAYAAKTWNIGAGASMLLDAPLVLSLGGYDTDMGPGGVGGCGEDTLVFYQILRAGRTIHYEPRSIVHHNHRSNPVAFRKHIHSYAVGHAAYHTRCLFGYGDYRSLFQLVYHLPRWFIKNALWGMKGKTKYPFWLVGVEARGTVAGVIQYASVKLRRGLTALFGRQQAADRTPRSAGTEPSQSVLRQVAPQHVRNTVQEPVSAA